MNSPFRKGSGYTIYASRKSERNSEVLQYSEYVTGIFKVQASQ